MTLAIGKEPLQTLLTTHSVLLVIKDNGHFPLGMYLTCTFTDLKNMQIWIFFCIKVVPVKTHPTRLWHAAGMRKDTTSIVHVLALWPMLYNLMHSEMFKQTTAFLPPETWENMPNWRYLFYSSRVDTFVANEHLARTWEHIRKVSISY
jgi:hypothetical protein